MSANSAVPPAGSPNLRDRAMRGSVWAIAEYLVNNVLRFGSNLVLAYALFPEAFALVAYASIVLSGLQMFSDFGIGPAVVQSPRGDEPAFLNTAWTVQVFRGVLLFLVTLLLGWPMAQFYNEPQLVWLVPACGLNLITTGLQSTAVYTCGRSLAVGRLAIWGITETVLKTAITIVWAWFWPSVWAIVGGAFLSYTVGMVLTHTLLPGIRNRIHWDREAAKSLLHFGRWVFVSTILTFLAGQADRLILGKLVSMSVVGVYSIALMFVRLPYEICVRLSGIILFPALSAVARRDRQTLHGRFLESRDAILAVVQLGIAAVVLPSPWFFHLLYDDRYSAASLYAPLLAGAIWFSALQASADRALVALGDNRPLAISNFANLVCTVSGSLLGYQIAEMQGFIAGVALGSCAGHSIISWTLYLRGLSVVAQDLRYTAIVMVTCCISIFQPLNDSRWQIALAVIWFLFSAMYAYRRVGRLAKEALQKILRRIVPQAP